MRIPVVPVFEVKVDAVEGGRLWIVDITMAPADGVGDRIKRER